MVAVEQKTSFYSARLIPTRFGGLYVGLSMFAPVLLIFAMQSTLPDAGRSEVFAFTTWWMARSGSMVPSGFSSLFGAESRVSASATWCFIPA